MTRSRMMAPRLAALSFFASLVSCSEDRPDITDPLQLAAEFAVILSDPVPGSSPALTGLLDAARASSSATVGEAVYVSILPGTVAGGVRVVLRNLETGFARTVPLVDGGLDPVSVPATVRDRLELVATLGGGATLRSVVEVPARRPPRVVRTVPPRGKTDVPLNARISVVFSEPIDARTLTMTSVRLLRGTDPVAGQLEFVDANRLMAVLIPETPLAPATGYQLVVSQAIRDRDGESLEASVTIDFTTCANDVDRSNCPPDPTSGSGLVSGVVSVRAADGVQPLPNAIVGGVVFIIKPDVLHARAVAATTTDAGGGYRLTGVPDGFVVLHAGKDGYDQPCVATATVRADAPATSNIELVSQLDPHPEWATASPSIRGSVYETTPEGRRPVPGAWVVYELQPSGGVTAATTTNEAGQFALCGLPSGQGGWLEGGWVTAVKPGYKTRGAVFVINNDQILDMELTRP